MLSIHWIWRFIPIDVQSEKPLGLRSTALEIFINNLEMTNMVGIKDIGYDFTNVYANADCIDAR